MTGLEGLTDLGVVADITLTAERNPETHYQTLPYVGTVKSDMVDCFKFIGTHCSLHKCNCIYGVMRSKKIEQ